MAAEHRWVPPIPRLLVVLAAASATLLMARPGSLADPIRDQVLADSNLEMSRKSLWIAAAAFPGFLAPFLAALSDIVRLGSTRRRPWLLLATAAAIPLWLILASVPEKLGVLLAVQLPLALVVVVFHVAERGLAVDVGQHYGVTGAISSVHILVAQAGSILLMAVVPAFRERHLIWTALFAAVILLAFGYFAARALRFEPQPFRTISSPLAAFRTMLSSRTFWISGLLIFLVSGAFRGLNVHLRNMVSFRGDSSGELIPGWSSTAVVVLGAIAYFWLCQRSALRGLLLAAVGMAASAAALTLMADSVSLAVVAEGQEALMGLALLPLMDLALRAAPSGLEALGFTLLYNVPVAVGTVLVIPLVALAERRPETQVLVLVAMSLAGLVPALLLPPSLVERREGELETSQEMHLSERAES